jgi:hypothetical protein
MITTTPKPHSPIVVYSQTIMRSLAVLGLTVLSLTVVNIDLFFRPMFSDTQIPENSELTEIVFKEQIVSFNKAERPGSLLSASCISRVILLPTDKNPGWHEHDYKFK